MNAIPFLIGALIGIFIIVCIVTYDCHKTQEYIQSVEEDLRKEIVEIIRLYNEIQMILYKDIYSLKEKLIKLEQNKKENENEKN